MKDAGDIFELFHIEDREIRYNYFIANLLRTINREHKLGEFVNKLTGVNVDCKKLEVYDDFSIEGCIPDIVITDNREHPKEAEFMLLIENKLLSSENEGQTKAYLESFHSTGLNIYLFMTLNSEKPESNGENEFQPITHHVFVETLNYFSSYFNEYEQIAFLAYQKRVVDYSALINAGFDGKLNDYREHAWRTKAIQYVIDSNGYRKDGFRMTSSKGASNEIGFSFTKAEWTAQNKLDVYWDVEKNPLQCWAVNVNLMFSSDMQKCVSGISVVPHVESWHKLTGVSKQLQVWNEIENIFGREGKFKQRRWGWNSTSMDLNEDMTLGEVWSDLLMSDTYEPTIWDIAQKKVNLLKTSLIV